jgi:hypothetical protein
MGIPYITTNTSSMDVEDVPLSLNAGMSDCPASSQSGTGMNRNADAGTSPVPEKWDPVRYRNAQDRAEIQDAGMPMPAASTSMPSYGEWYSLLTPQKATLDMQFA